MRVVELYTRVSDMLLQDGRKIPPSSWHRLKVILVHCLQISPREITRDSWLVRDLGTG